MKTRLSLLSIPLNTCDKEVMWSDAITVSHFVRRFYSTSTYNVDFGKFVTFFQCTEWRTTKPNRFRLPQSKSRNKLLPVLRFWRMFKLNNIKSIHNFIRSSSSYIKRCKEIEWRNATIDPFCLCSIGAWVIKSDYLISRMVSNEMCARVAVQLRRKLKEFYYYSAHDS